MLWLPNPPMNRADRLWQPHVVDDAHPRVRETNPLALVIPLVGIAAALVALAAR